MKDFIIKILAVICIYLCGYLFGLITFNRYDVNRDGKVTAQDYVAVKNYIMEQQ